MSIRRIIELNIVHPVDPANGKGYQVGLVDITDAAYPQAVFTQGGNSVPASPFLYDYALEEDQQLKFGHRYRVSVQLTDVNNTLYSAEHEFGAAEHDDGSVIVLKLARG